MRIVSITVLAAAVAAPVSFILGFAAVGATFLSLGIMVVAFSEYTGVPTLPATT